MNILVTGGNGFIGSHVTTQLVESGHTVTCFDKREKGPLVRSVEDAITYIRGDITDPVTVYNTIASTKPDRIIHLVSLLGRESQANPYKALSVNVLGSIYVIEAAIAHNVERLVGASSAASYGAIPQSNERLDETVIQQPQSIYGLCKYVLERLGETYARQADIEFAAVQPVHGFGPDRNRGNVEDAFLLKAAVSGVPYTTSDWDAPMELIAVEDEARAFVAATLADELAHTRYLIGSGKATTLTEINELVESRLPNIGVTIDDPADPESDPVLPLTDTSRIKNDIGWEPTYSIPDMVYNYLDWLTDNPDAWTFPPTDPQQE